ncbi:hypothetical protein GIB67_038236, partial [Kingdonia uniflora]
RNRTPDSLKSNPIVLDFSISASSVTVEVSEKTSNMSFLDRNESRFLHFARTWEGFHLLVWLKPPR